MPWWSFVAKKQTFESCKNTPLSFLFQLCFFIFFKHNSHFHLCVSVTHLQVFSLPLFWNVDCESHSLRFWLPFKVRHMAHSKTGCTSINQSWRHHYKVLLIASMGMGAYSLRQSDSSRHTEIGWINSPSSSLYWTSLLITLLLFFKKKSSSFADRVILLRGQHLHILIYIWTSEVWCCFSSIVYNRAK